MGLYEGAVGTETRDSRQQAGSSSSSWAEVGGAVGTVLPCPLLTVSEQQTATKLAKQTAAAATKQLQQQRQQQWRQRRRLQHGRAAFSAQYACCAVLHINGPWLALAGFACWLRLLRCLYALLRCAVDSAVWCCGCVLETGHVFLGLVEHPGQMGPLFLSLLCKCTFLQAASSPAASVAGKFGLSAGMMGGQSALKGPTGGPSW